MALEKIKALEKIEVMSNGIVLVKYGIAIVEDNQQLAKTYERISYAPVDDISNADEKVKNVCQAIWTADVIEKFKQEIAEKLA